MDEQEYGHLLRLEELESLLEELEEAGLTEAPPERIPAELRDWMADLGVTRAGEIRQKIADAHAHLDEERNP